MGAIDQFLLDTIGLDSESVGNNTIQRTVTQRMRALGISDEVEYLRRIKRDPRELQGLIDNVTVPETWFFRDKEPFHMLGNLVRTRWSPPSKTKPLRILSLPCATGEEPYSIAMVLKDMGFNADTVRIDAVDISVRALDRAQQAVYGSNSFRGDEGDYLGRHFEKTTDGYVLHEGIKRMVSFRHGNLFHESFLSGAEQYEIIFCRNVLIYFSHAQQEKAIVKLHRLLVCDGVLFVGHAEGGRLLGDYFLSLKQSGTFAFQRQDKARPAEPMAIPIGAMIIPSPPPKRRPRSNVIEVDLVASAKAELHCPAAKKDAADASVLDEIQHLADQGNLAEAAERCARFLSEHSVSADGYYLMGLIRQAEGRDALAAELFRKAVYLDARHYQALVHLAVQAEHVGNVAAAAVYRSRASRVLAKK